MRIKTVRSLASLAFDRTTKYRITIAKRVPSSDRVDRRKNGDARSACCCGHMHCSRVVAEIEVAFAQQSSRFANTELSGGVGPTSPMISSASRRLHGLRSAEDHREDTEHVNESPNHLRHILLWPSFDLPFASQPRGHPHRPWPP